MQLVIIAGGKGTRLGLKDIPKPMVKVGDKPILQYQIELAKKYGITKIYILTGFLSEVIEDYFKDGSEFGVKIKYIKESLPLGTAGCLSLLKNEFKKRFMVFYGDIMADFDIEQFIEFDKKNNTIGTIILHPNDHPFDSDLVEIDESGKVTAFIPKPHKGNCSNLVNAAAYILSPEIFKYIKDNTPQDFGKDIFPKILKNKEILTGYKTAEYIKDMGTKERYERVCKDFASGKIARLNKKNKRKAIFLDRDGVINENMDNTPSLERFHLLHGVEDAVKKINTNEYLAVVVTNQPMIAKGFISRNEVIKIHKKLETVLGQKGAYLDAIYFCPHHPDKGYTGEISELKIDCSCRKPKTGMFLQAKKDLNIDFKGSWMIGDSRADIEAGRTIGVKTISIKEPLGADFLAKNLCEAVDIIIREDKI